MLTDPIDLDIQALIELLIEEQGPVREVVFAAMRQLHEVDPDLPGTLSGKFSRVRYVICYMADRGNANAKTLIKDFNGRANTTNPNYLL
jgi:hypothetical protein